MTISRSLQEGSDFLYNVKYSLNVHRSRIDPERLREAKNLFEELSPVTSGRLYHTLEVCESEICKEISNRMEYPLSKSTILRKIIRKERIHHTRRNWASKNVIYSFNYCVK